jgi:PIN domain nuclease of toxin-antitoxin system
VQEEKKLSSTQLHALRTNETVGLGISAISCWEVAKLVEYKRLVLSCSITEWFQKALAYPGMRLLDLSPEIAVESTQLPNFQHRDPADQLIVATARIHQCPLVTSDAKLLEYPKVRSIA